MALSTNQIKSIRSLQQKKFRNESGLFVAEGAKIVNELLHSNIEVDHIYTTNENNTYPSQISTRISTKELQRISGLNTANEVLCTAKIRTSTLELSSLSGKISLAFETIQDPGNLGTIIRTADWFGIENIICSEDSVSCYNPKVVQGTMGSIARVNVHYTDVLSLITQSEISSYGATLTGTPLGEITQLKEGIIVFGNESQGISELLQAQLDHTIFISGSGSAESLNIGVATGIILASLTPQR